MKEKQRFQEACTHDKLASQFVAELEELGLAGLLDHLILVPGSTQPSQLNHTR